MTWMKKQDPIDPVFTNIGSKKIRKDDIILNAIGDLDELNSFIDICYCNIKNNDLLKILSSIQNNIFVINSELVSIINPVFKPNNKFTEKDVEEIQGLIQKFNHELKRPKKFIVFHQTQSACLGYARTIARRAERALILASSKYNIKNEIIKYLNKLSLLLFMIALYITVTSFHD